MMKNKTVRSKASQKPSKGRVRQSWKTTVENKIFLDLKNAKLDKKGLIQNIFWTSGDSVIEFILKEKCKYLEHHDILIQILTAVQDKVKAKYDEVDQNVILSSILNDEEIRQVCTELGTFLDSIPRKYILLAELPSLKDEGTGNFNISDKVRAVEIYPAVENKKLTLSQLALGGTWALLGNGNENLKTPPGLYLLVDTIGYANYSYETQAVIDGISVLKQALMLLRESDCIKFNYNPAKSAGLKSKIYIYDCESRKEPIEINAPDSLTEMIAKIGLSPKKIKEVEAFKTRDQAKTYSILTEPHNPYPLLQLNKKRQQIIDSSLDNVNATSMKNALIWGFDSYMNSHDTTISFIQIAIALEALLGADSEGPSKTRLLADRCAMLTSNTIEGRAKTRAAFEKFYRVRSALIHGSVTKLDFSVKEWLFWGNNTFNRLISRELFFAKFDNKDG